MEQSWWFGVCVVRWAKNRGVLAWHPRRPYLCTEYASNSVFGYLVWGCLKCRMPKISWGFDVAPQASIPLHQICQQQCFWIPGMGVFEMQSAKKSVFLAWRPKRAYQCTKYTSSSVSGYLVPGCNGIVPGTLGIPLGNPGAVPCALGVVLGSHGVVPDALEIPLGTPGAVPGALGAKKCRTWIAL